MWAKWFLVSNSCRIHTPWCSPFVVLVTGASRGLGLASAKAYAQSGASLFITARSTSALQQIKEQFEEEYKVSIGYATMDTVNEDSVKSSVDAAVKQFGKIDVVIANGEFDASHVLIAGWLSINFMVLQPEEWTHSTVSAWSRTYLAEMITIDGCLI
jgi:NAD(P)-dependent dehydrogenase (short-subunit alcohol dehydrogenase family)